MLRAVQVMLDEGLAKPILIGRPEIVARRIAKLGLRLSPGKDFELINPDDDPRHLEYSAAYHKLAAREGVSPEVAKLDMRRRPTLIAAMLIRMGAADAMICGTVGQYQRHLANIHNAIGRAPGALDLRGDEHADPAAAHAVHLRHLRQPGPDTPSSSPR